MYELIADILRGAVTNVLIVLLIFSLSQRRFSKKVTISILALVMILVLLLNIYFYLQQSYNLVAQSEFILLLIVAFAIKPLFKDKLMQWLFKFVTMLNIYVIIVIFSYVLCDFLPHPYYAVILLRIAMFLAIIFAIKKALKSLYLQASERWSIYFMPGVLIFTNFCYYLLFQGDIEDSIFLNFPQLCLLTILTVAVYFTITFSLRSVAAEYLAKEEKLQADARQELLAGQLKFYQTSVDVSKQMRHDLRHHNRILFDLLVKKDIKNAIIYLEQFENNISDTVVRQYCKNECVNTILSFYNSRADASNIKFCVSTTIEDVSITAPDLTSIFANILENACEACEKTSELSRFISISATTDEEKLSIEIRNSSPSLEEERAAVTLLRKKVNNGLGLKSVENIVKKHNGMLRYYIEKDIFNTQIVLPLKM